MYNGKFSTPVRSMAAKIFKYKEEYQDLTLFKIYIACNNCNRFWIFKSLITEKFKKEELNINGIMFLKTLIDNISISLSLVPLPSKRELMCCTIP